MIDTNGHLEFNGDAFSHIVGTTFDNLAKLAVYAQDKLMAAISTPNTGVRVTRKRSTSAGAKGTQYTIYPHSAPKGMPPHKRTGNLQRNVAIELLPQQLKVKLGVTRLAPYGLILELKDHPWFLDTLRKYEEQLKRIATTGKE